MGLGYASTLAGVLVVSLAGMVAGDGTDMRGATKTAVATTAAAGGAALTVVGFRLLRDPARPAEADADADKRANVTG